MTQTDRTASSRQLAAQCSTPTGVSLCTSSIRRRLLQSGLRARIPLYMIPLTQNHCHLRLEWDNVHRSWRADWHTRYIKEVLQPQAIPFLEGLPGAVFQQDNVRPHVAKTVKSYLHSQQVQLLPWPAYSPDMSPIEHVWDIVGQRLARDLRPVASTDELWFRIQTIWNTLSQADIQNLFNSMPRPKQSVLLAMTKRVIFQRRSGASALLIHVVPVRLLQSKSIPYAVDGLSCSGRKFFPTDT
ncbi:transposable element Tcb2 transposase [Trichonephila clavipes]|nr:transposable element Tcb2 transposase [Trichonephila clavipes]